MPTRREIEALVDERVERLLTPVVEALHERIADLEKRRASGSTQPSPAAAATPLEKNESPSEPKP